MAAATASMPQAMRSSGGAGGARPRALSTAPRASTTQAAAQQQAFMSTKTWQPQGFQPIPDTSNVSGAHRFKYFKRPIIPFLNAMPPEVVFAQAQSAAALESLSRPELEPHAREMGTQSDYRENEVQTDPFTPDYYVKEGATPELLSLASLTYAGGALPAGLAEVKMIERARQKRAFEASMPPMTDESSLELRRTMMGQQEMREFRVREEEIKEMQDGRVEQFAAQLRHAAEAVGKAWEDRVEHTRQIKLTEKDKALSAIQRRRIKALRKLSEARKDVDVDEPGAGGRDIVKDYSDYSSSVYAPLTREGRVAQDKLSHLYETDPAHLKGLHKLVALEASLPASALHAKVVKPPRPTEKRHLSLEERKEKKIRDALEHMDLTIKLAKQTKPSEKEQKEALLAAYRVVKPLERPPTPRTDAPDVEDEIEIAAMLLQRLLRGRAVQNMMFEGKERRLELIQELRAEEALGVEEARASGAEAVAKTLAATMESLQGELVSKTLDYLAKELVRFKDERQIAEMVRQAEWTRRQREAEESGRRQLELLQREEDERRWREAMGVHQATADTFLAEIVSDAVDVVAARQARVEMDTAREKYLTSGANGEAKTIVLDLVSAFLFPEVDRLHKHLEAMAYDQRFATAADAAASSATISASK